jgi:hypothetical protein
LTDKLGLSTEGESFDFVAAVCVRVGVDGGGGGGGRNWGDNG